MPRAARLLTLIATAAGVAACGSLPVHELPPAAAPARAPRTAVAPAGRVVPVGRHPEGVAVSPAGDVAAVALHDPAALALVDARSGRVRRTVALPDAGRHLAVAAGRTFVADERANTLTVLAGHGARVVATLPVATQPGGVASVAAGRAVAVVSLRERVLEIYDARTLRRVARVGAGIGPTHVVGDATGDHLYVVDTAGGALLVYDLRPRLELVRRYALPGSPYGVALDPVRRRLWVTLTARNEVVELPAHGRPYALRRLATVRQPDSVAVDSATGRLFITGRDAGALQIVDP